MSSKAIIHDAAVHVATGFQKYVYVEWFIAHKNPCYSQKVHLLTFTTSLCSPEGETAISIFFLPHTHHLTLFHGDASYLCSQKMTLQLFF